MISEEYEMKNKVIVANVPDISENRVSLEDVEMAGGSSFCSGDENDSQTDAEEKKRYEMREQDI